MRKCFTGSGQMKLDGLKQIINDYGIKTVVTLRDARGSDGHEPDLAEKKFCQDQGINYYSIPSQEWFGTGMPLFSIKG